MQGMIRFKDENNDIIGGYDCLDGVTSNQLPENAVSFKMSNNNGIKEVRIGVEAKNLDEALEICPPHLRNITKVRISLKRGNIFPMCLYISQDKKSHHQRFDFFILRENDEVVNDWNSLKLALSKELDENLDLKNGLYLKKTKD